ncbi:MAG: YdcH family protein [Gammaproteobacteria bacterium]|nr:YdcH family protein [Gammaproteobacteria bacterium]
MNTIPDHSLYSEFPEYENRIRELVASDSGFARMAGEYHSLDAEIHVLEERDVPTSDFYFEDLKKKRAYLKDRVYSQLLDGQASMSVRRSY